MKVLVVGQGGREHALLWKIKKDKSIRKLYCAPGNGGTAEIADNVPIRPDDMHGLCDFCRREKVDLTIVGPEAPLAEGIVDLFVENGLRIFGPTRQAAKLESSKVFTKNLCRTAGIPTAWFEVFTDAARAKDFIKSKGAPLVIKADGLAAGKGVIVAETEEEALAAVDRIMLRKEFGASGDRIIVEEYLEGEEASIIVVSDGENIVPLASSQDHKRIFDGDKGPNTGGMGAYSPAPVVTEEIFSKTLSQLIEPAIRGMKAKGTPYKGVLYAGVMIVNNEPKLLEFNVRFGDPETQAILPRLNSSLLGLIEASIEGNIKNYSLKWNKRACACIVIASGGYPGKYKKGKEIRGLKEVLELPDTTLFHAGTKIEDSKIVTNGGRVLNIVALGKDIENAVNKAYKACRIVSFENMHYRNDIGYKALDKIGAKNG